MKSIDQIHQLGQSLWYDNIQRRLLRNGELEGMITRREILGVTSNPSIFQNAIAKSNDYDSAMKPMAWAGWNADEIFWELAVEDIRAAADLFRPIYDETTGGDGYVSLEVNPNLAHDAEGTYQEAIKLWHRVNRENLMIKIPATKEGVVAVKKAIAAGLNINVTLIFSLERYQEVIDAYIGGLEERVSQGKSVENISSVASFFVSRVDTKIDARLQKLVEAGGADAKAASQLLGKAAICNVKLAYQLFKKNFSTSRFEKLRAVGAKLQRPLWASTSTKNPAYRDVIYIEELIGADTVNTVPPQTLIAFANHGKAELTVEKDVEKAKEELVALDKLGISMGEVTEELEIEGVKAFADAFQSLLGTIEEKAQKAQKELGPLAGFVAKEAKNLDEIKAVKRLFEVDSTLWTDDPAGQAEIKKRSDWLNAPWVKAESIADFEHLRKHCQSVGITHALLLGMGGSSLAPEVMRLVNGVTENQGIVGLDLAILDSTDPGQVKAALDRSPVEKTLYIVSSKSGGTAEVNAFFDFFWKKSEEKLGKKAGEHFIAITDPGTTLEKLAGEKDFWHVYLGNPQVGGRNSALTSFGLIPAALIGMDVAELLENARNLADQCVPEVPLGANPGAVLGVILGAVWKEGKNKLTILADPKWDVFSSWMEQLIAESSGKQGKGIVPLAQEPYVKAGDYSDDRLFVYLRSTGDVDTLAAELRASGQAVVELDVKGAYDLAGQFYLWEVATAIACIVIGVNSFDQPDVQDNKTRTLDKISSFRETGKLAEKTPIITLKNGKVFGAEIFASIKADSFYNVIEQFLDKVVKKGDYIAINAYLPRNEQTIMQLTELRKQLLQKYKHATTLGFGPRFLHSTGQLHKGGPDSGVFIQITADPMQDLEIPEEGISFGTLERAQAAGDFEALEARGRRVIRIHLNTPDVTLLLA